MTLYVNRENFPSSFVPFVFTNRFIEFSSIRDYSVKTSIAMIPSIALMMMMMMNKQVMLYEKEWLGITFPLWIAMKTWKDKQVYLKPTNNHEKLIPHIDRKSTFLSRRETFFLTIATCYHLNPFFIIWCSYWIGGSFFYAFVWFGMSVCECEFCLECICTWLIWINLNEKSNQQAKYLLHSNNKHEIE